MRDVTREMDGLHRELHELREAQRAHNDLCLEVQRLVNEMAQARLALTYLEQRLERAEEELRLRQLNRRQPPVVVDPPPWTVTVTE